MIALLLALGLQTQDFDASFIGYSDLQPTRYRSRSGEWELLVDPSSPDGAGDARYVLTRNGEKQWESVFPFAYWRADVNDDGISAGFAYSDGVATWSGRLVTFALTAEGELRQMNSKLRGPSRFPDYVAVPSGLDLFIHPELNAVVVIVGDRETSRRGQQWRFYDLDTARLRRAVRPKEAQRGPRDLGAFLGGRPVLGTPLFLAHWRGSLAEDPIRFSLINELGRSVWALDRDDDLIGHEEESDRLGARGFLLEEDEPGSFAIWFRREEQRVRFGVEPGLGEEWVLHELSRESLAAPRDEPAMLPERPALLVPENLGSIDLSVDTGAADDSGAEARPEPAPEINGVGAFTLDGNDHIAFLPSPLLVGRNGVRAALTLVDTHGRRIAEHPLDAVPGSGAWIDVAWDPSPRFLLLRRTEEGGEIWSLDADTGELARLPVKTWWATSRVEALPGVGCVIQRGMTVLAYDDEGTQRWIVKGRSMAVLSDNRIAVLDVDWRVIRIHAPSGQLENILDLSAIWSGRPGEGTRLEPDHSGGVILVESGRRVVRMRFDGVVRTVYQPTYEDGRNLRLRDDVKLGPLGRVWTRDSFTLLRLDRGGVVEHRLGSGRSGLRDDVEAVAVGGDGRIFAVGKGMNSVRVLDSEGTHLFTCDPGAVVARTDPTMQHVAITVDPEDQILFSGRSGVFLFSPSGRLVDLIDRVFDPIRETWYALPHSHERLVVGHRRAYLIDDRGEVRLTIERRPDGRWLKHVYQAAVAPDGSFVLLTGPLDDPGQREPPGLHVYAPNGAALRSIWLPVDSETLPYVAYDGQRIVYFDECQAFVYGADGSALGTFELPGEPGLDSWVPLLPPGGSELWAFDLRHTIERYALD